MARGKNHNPFAAKKRQKRENGGDTRPDRQSHPYEDIVRENAAFMRYYESQKICSTQQEWEQFLASIKTNLPTTFRVTGHREEAKALLEVIETELFTKYVDGVAELHGIPKEEVNRPLRLPWYPDNMAFQLHLTRKDIRRSEPLFRLHNFLIVETKAGSISRQEAVSMIPPLVLNVQPTDKVLDMCAAPGSKTAQLIEALHSGQEKIPSGFVVANDVDNNRCYMLVHQAKRLNSPCIVVTNHDSTYFPDLLKSDEDGQKSMLKFNKILCDVPCSGDGTMRKNPDIWTKWNLAQSYNLHGLQHRITMRGAEMLEVGGRMVYSTCSLNPVENEAVLQRVIMEADGALEIVDASDLVPGLQFNPGMTSWVLASKEVDKVFTSYEQVPENYHTIIRPTMFPLPKEEIGKIGLEKCMRLLPHLQDSGGFFVAVLEKKSELPSEKARKVHRLEEKEKSFVQNKRRRLFGYREDPYNFFKASDPDWDEIKQFYDLEDSMSKCLLTRCAANKKKNIYYCSERIRDLVLLNEDTIKIINTGVKTFVRCENRHTTHPFRLAQEGLMTINAFMGQSRRMEIEREDLVLLLNCSDPTKPPSTTLLKEATEARCMELGVGSCILKYVDPRFTLHVVGWRGTSSLRAYVDTNDTVHILRLMGEDIEKFDVNKFEKAKEAAESVASSSSSGDTKSDAGPETPVTQEDKLEMQQPSAEIIVTTE